MVKEKPPTRPTPRTKSRRHGYRGYGSPLHKDIGGAIHYPRGFTGVEFQDRSSLLSTVPEPAEELPEDQPKPGRPKTQ